MSTDLSSSNNKLLKNIANLIGNDNSLENLYKQTKQEQQKQLSEIFTQATDNNASASDKKALEAQAQSFKNKVSELEKKMAALEEEIAQKEEEVNEKTNEITSIISAVDSKSAQMETKQATIVKNCIEDVFYCYSQGSIGRDEISPEIRRRIQGSKYLNSQQAQIEKLLGNLDSNQSAVDALVADTTNVLDALKPIQTQYGVNKSSYNLIQKTISQFGGMTTSYTNSDYDSYAPIYSLNKLDYASDLLANPKYNVEATNSDYIAGSKAGDFTKVEKTAPTTTYKDTQRVVKEGDKKYTVTDRATTVSRTETEYPKDTYSKAGNTIKSNNQIKALSENYSTILDGLKSNGFTFKEAMFLLFDKDNGLFKDSGVSYDLSEQSSGVSNYNIAKAGDGETKQMYDNLAYKIKQNWGVSATNANSEIKTKTISDTKTQEINKVPKFDGLDDLTKQLGISNAEKALLDELIKSGKVNLTDKLPDGSPRYIFAPGANDKKYHIYDMATRYHDGGGTSLARLYGDKNQKPRGADIVPNGNGYIYNYEKNDESGKYQIFYYKNSENIDCSKANYKTCSPIVLDLTGEGININTEKTVKDDIDGDGVVDEHFDISANNAILVWDADKNGVSGEGGSEYFGNNTVIDGKTYENGFEALKALALKDGLIDGKEDNELNEDDIKYLEENYGLKLKVGSYDAEATSLLDSGITSIKLAKTSETKLNTTYQNTVDNVMTQEGATFTINGQEREYADVWHKKLDSESIANLNSKDIKEAVKEPLHDPMTFRMGDTEYAFVIDRNNDGKFSGKNEFVGGSEGSTWYEDLISLDSDGDGKLSGDELKNLKIIGAEYQDNKSTGATDINYSFTSAQNMGIDEIDLSKLEEMVNKSKGETDLNGSELFNDSISFKMNGKDITASRKDETARFINTIYGKAQGKDFEVQMSKGDAQEAINDGYKKIDEFNAKHAEFFQNLNMLKKFDALRTQAKEMYNQTNNRIDQETNVALMQSSNKAAALANNVRDWSTVSSEIRTLAQKEGLSIDMEQAKGIYVIDGSLDARGVINKYKEQTEEANNLNKEQSIQSTAWQALIKCYKNGINATAQEIKEVLVNGKATNADEVVEYFKNKAGIVEE